MLLPSQIPAEIRTSKIYFALLEKFKVVSIMTLILELKMPVPYGVMAHTSTARMMAY